VSVDVLPSDAIDVLRAGADFEAVWAICALHREDPSQSNRWIARTASVSHP
jgi:hypothetical protein